jgi:hypothetical protein
MADKMHPKEEEAFKRFLDEKGWKQIGPDNRMVSLSGLNIEIGRLGDGQYAFIITGGNGIDGRGPFASEEASMKEAWMSFRGHLLLRCLLTEKL